MITPNELRLGNWVNDPIQSKCGFYENFVQLNTAIGSAGNEFEPIPLTPEILEQCGFKKHIDDEPDDCCELYLDGTVDSLRVDVSPTGYAKDDFIEEKFSINFGFPEMELHLWCQHYEPNISIEFKNIKYLHQLQNIIFALTGKELNISDLVSRLSVQGKS